METFGFDDKVRPWLSHASRAKKHDITAPQWPPSRVSSIIKRNLSKNLHRPLLQSRILIEKVTKSIADVVLELSRAFFPESHGAAQHCGENEGSLLVGEKRNPRCGLMHCRHLGNLLASAMWV